MNEKEKKLINIYISILRITQTIHQNNHWLTKGNNFYGNHLLFERLYNTSSENLDAASEKFVGLFGSECFDFPFQLKVYSDMLSAIYKATSPDPITISLNIEQRFVKFSEDIYKSLKEANILTLGLDDMIMAIHSDHETNLYLLKQTIDN